MFRLGTWKRKTFDDIDKVLRTRRLRNPVAVALALMSEKNQALFLAVRGHGLPKHLAAKLMGINRRQVTARLKRGEKLIRFVADALLVKEVQGVAGETWRPDLAAVGQVA